MTRPTALAAHVYAVREGDWVVFYDVKQDRYSALPAHAADAKSWAALGVDVGACDHSVDAKVDLTGLLGRSNLLDVGAPACAAAGPPLAWLRALPDGLAFLYACVWARALVRRRRLDLAYANLSIWKRAVAPAVPTKPMLAYYEAARPWFPERRVCLFDSLSLLTFILSRGACAELVIGVRGRPFAAHCWLEGGGEILNSPSDACIGHAPILRI
ncbi:lasso peptide biosynthesis B2 protein [Vitreimonas sp.]|uniref:lasso peptide biosynthesis B2 protein n=1 Tax=Vitreimonas sp. TaxID=3069702 RepID=UPI002ED9F21D